MKKILITGANSYIGTSFEKYIHDNYPEEYVVDVLDLMEKDWNEKSFSGYDSIVHVAGIAHQKETKDNAQDYYFVNRDLAIDVASKVKRDGVRQFVFMSSMSVYGMETGIITKDTVPHPDSNYGKSKLQAEQSISKLADEQYKVCILRPPMVYGNGCKGNFQTLLKLVKISPVFPKINNERSMIYIENLCSFICLCIRQELGGIYFPQNREYMNTSFMAETIADSLNKKIYVSRLAGSLIGIGLPYVRLLQKAFGTLIYKDMEAFEYCYCIKELEESVKKSSSL